MLGNEAHKLNGNTEDIVRLYKHRLKACRTTYVEVKNVEPYFGAPNNQVVLECWYIMDEETKPKSRGFTGDLDNGYQYNLRTYNGTRPRAWRVPFLGDPNYANDEYTVSHLCHDPYCYRWSHHVLERLEVNKGRNGCPGGAHCHHQHRCLIPGPFYNW